MAVIDLSTFSSLSHLVSFLKSSCRDSEGHIPKVTTFVLDANAPWIQADADFEPSRDFADYCQALQAYSIHTSSTIASNTSSTTTSSCNVLLRLPAVGFSLRRLRLVGAILCHVNPDHLHSLTVKIESSIETSPLHQAQMEWLLSLCQGIQSLALECHFSTLHQIQGFHDAAIHALCLALETNSSRLQHVQEFRLEGYRIRSHTSLFRTLCRTLPNLQAVTLRGMGATYLDTAHKGLFECQALQALLSLTHFQHLKLVNLVFWPCHCQALAEACIGTGRSDSHGSDTGSTSSTGIRSLILEACRFHVQGLSALARGISLSSSLQSLACHATLSFVLTAMTCTECLPLRDLPLNLQSLSLVHVPLTIQQTLVPSWSRILGQLREIHFRACNLSSSSPGSRRWLSHILAANTDSMELLTIQDMLIEEKDLGPLPSQLKQLVLSNCGLTDSCIQRIFPLPPCLETLTISKNHLVSQNAIGSVLHAIHCYQCPTTGSYSGRQLLLHIDISDTCILSSPQSHQLVLKILSGNPYLTSLQVQTSNPTIQARIAILERLNRAGRSYLANGAQFNMTGGLRVLANVSNNLDDVFTHLLENPSLVVTTTSRNTTLAPEKRIQRHE